MVADKMTENQFKVTNISSNGMTGLFWLGKDKLSVYDVVKLLNELFGDVKRLGEENGQLKNQNELLSDELEQCKAVIDNKWGEYLKKKERQEND